MLTTEDEQLIDQALWEADWIERNEERMVKGAFMDNQITIFLSTDGKHTVQINSTIEKGQEALIEAKKLYDDILKTYGTKQEQSVKAYAAKPGFPDDSGPIAHEAQPGISFCAIHKTPMQQRTGKFGTFWSCGQKNPDGTWCKYKPTEQK